MQHVRPCVQAQKVSSLASYSSAFSNEAVGSDPTSTLFLARFERKFVGLLEPLW